MEKKRKNIICIMIGFMAIFLVGCANISTSANETSVVKDFENSESTTKVSYTTNTQITKEVVTTKKTTTMEMVTTEQTTENEVEVTTTTTTTITAYVVKVKPLETTSTTENISPDTWEYNYVPVFDSNDLNVQNQNNEWDNSNSEGDDNTYYDDGLVWSNSVTLYTTNSEPASWYNILQASNMLNGFKLGPGETFDWFINMGPCSYEQGFIDAGAYVEGGSAPGGGICFVSTALMQAARGSNCNNMLYYDHVNPVSYATRGNEAAVSYGECDLVFSNPSQTTGLQFWVEVDETSHSITVSSNTYY